MLRRAALTFGLWAGLAATGWACDVNVTTPLQSVGLFSEAGMDWLPKDPGTAAKTETIRVYDAPGGQWTGTITVTYPPSDTMRFTYGRIGTEPAAFTPTIFDGDWGYGPWAHQAFLEQRGDWYRLALPAEAGQSNPGWVQLAHANVHTTDISSAVSYENQTYMVIARDTQSITLVPEYQILKYMHVNESACERIFGDNVVGLAAQLKATPVIVPLSKLYDDQCALRLVPVYTRGC